MNRRSEYQIRKENRIDVLALSNSYFIVRRRIYVPNESKAWRCRKMVIVDGSGTSTAAGVQKYSVTIDSDQGMCDEYIHNGNGYARNSIYPEGSGRGDGRRDAITNRNRFGSGDNNCGVPLLRYENE